MINPIEIEADSIYSRFEHYNIHYLSSPYLKVWKEVAKYIYGKVVDIGCGPGQFMSLCMEYPKVKSYIGYDISGVAIQKATEIKDILFSDKKISLFKKDLLIDKDIVEGDSYVLCEILEHIENDHEILKLIPSGKNVIITLPNYLGGSHVRKFDNEIEILERFSEISFEIFTECKNIGNTKITVCAGTKI